MVKVQELEKSSEPKGNNECKVNIKTIRKKSKSKKGKLSWRKPRGNKGVVYLSHIPHGFHEDQIEGYFKQFGKVTDVSVPRSKTGRIKGYAFIEFQHPEVAEIAADAMNNYLMFNRLLKAKYIPPNEQKPHYFVSAKKARLNHSTVAEKAKFEVQHNRKLKNRKLKIGLEAKQGVKLLHKAKMMKEKLKELGVEYDFEVQEGNLEYILEMKKQLAKKKNMSCVLSDSDKTISGDDGEELSSMEDEDSSSLSEKSAKKILSSKNTEKNRIKNKTKQKGKPVKKISKRNNSGIKAQLNKKTIKKSSQSINKTTSINQSINTNVIDKKCELANHIVKAKSTINIKSENSTNDIHRSKKPHSLKNTFEVKSIKGKNPVSKQLSPDKSGKSPKGEKCVLSSKLNKSQPLNYSKEQTVTKLKHSVKLPLSSQLDSPKRKSLAMENIIRTPHPKKMRSVIETNQKGMSSKQKGPLPDNFVEAKQNLSFPFKRKPRHRALRKLGLLK